MVTAKVEDDLDSKPKEKVAATKRQTKKKPKDKPKRPLSAYNFFFKEEREKILKVVQAEDPMKVQEDPEADDYLDEDMIGRLKKEGGKVSFEEMGKIIGQRWKNIDPDRLSKYAELASEDTERYKNEMQSYNGRQEAKMRSEALKPPVAFSGGPAGGPTMQPDRGQPVYGSDMRGYPGYADMSGSAYGGMGASSMGGMGGAYGYGDFSGYPSMGMSGYGGGMSMGGYGAYNPSMEPPSAYGSGSYGGMGMMGSASYQSQMMGYPQDQYGQPQMDQQQLPQYPPQGGGAYGAYGQSGWGQG